MTRAITTAAAFVLMLGAVQAQPLPPCPQAETPCPAGQTDCKAVTPDCVMPSGCLRRDRTVHMQDACLFPGHVGGCPDPRPLVIHEKMFCPAQH